MFGFNLDNLELMLPILKKELKKREAKSIIFALDNTEKGYSVTEKKYNANDFLEKIESFLEKNIDCKEKFVEFLKEK